MALETAQDVEGPRHHLDHIAVARQVAGEHSLLTQSLRASSHIFGSIPPCGIKFHLRKKLPQAICGYKQKAVREDKRSVRRSPGEWHARYQDHHRSRRPRVCASCCNRWKR